MFKKTLLAAVTVAAALGTVTATTGAASAHGYRNVEQRLVCQPVFQWKTIWDSYSYRYVQVRVKVSENCTWVSSYAPRHHHRHHYNY